MFIQHYHTIFTVIIFSQTCRGPVARLLLRRTRSLRSSRVVVVLAMAVLAEVVFAVVVLAVVVLAEVVLAVVVLAAVA